MLFVCSGALIPLPGIGVQPRDHAVLWRLLLEWATVSRAVVSLSLSHGFWLLPREASWPSRLKGLKILSFKFNPNSCLQLPLHPADNGCFPEYLYPAVRVQKSKPKDEDLTMNNDEIGGNWKQFKGTIKEKWGKLTDDDMTVIEGKREQLVGKIQERYGYAKDQADKEVKDWESGNKYRW